MDTSTKRRSSVAIIAHNALGALVSGREGHIGGVEHQTSLLARWLSRNGYQVNVLTWDEPLAANLDPEGIRIIRICRQAGGWPGLRFLHPRWSGLVRSLREADADVYYHNGAECVTGQVGLWCRQNGRRFVFSAAADADVDRSLPALRRGRDRWLYRAGLKCADQVIVQSRKQQSLLKKRFGLNSVVLPMPCPEQADDYSARAWPGSPRLLWVGRISPVKRLEWFVELARRCPTMRFDVVGPDDSSPYARTVLEEARKQPNLTLHGRKTRQELVAFYRAATFLVCTSIREGFPNTFLEAWSHGLPVLSTLDIDGLLREHGLGHVAETLPLLGETLHNATGRPDTWIEMSKRVRLHFVSNHAMERAMPRFAECLVPPKTS